MENKRVGRHSVVTPDVVGKLEFSFINGMNVTEACFYAEISRDAYYAFARKFPEFSDRMEGLQCAVSITAKMIIAAGINAGDVRLSMWYLERRNKDEFFTR